MTMLSGSAVVRQHLLQGLVAIAVTSGLIAVVLAIVLAFVDQSRLWQGSPWQGSLWQRSLWQRSLWQGLGAATLSVTVSLLVTLPLILASTRVQPHLATQCLLVTGMVRLIVAAACVLVLVAALKYPPTPSFLLTLPLYLAVLIVETRLVYRHVSAQGWKKSASSL